MTGREYQHLEDLVFCEEQGAQRALYVLKNLENFKVSIKWDGMPSIYFGKDANGKFILVGKNGWGKEWINSPEELEQWTLSKGKNEYWRASLAANLANCWRIIEPHYHEIGFVYADVLWSPEKPAVLARKREEIFFFPNQVTYTVGKANPLFEDIKNSKLGIAVHSKFEAFGDTQGVPVYSKMDLRTPNIIVVPQTVVSDGMEMPRDLINALERKINRNYDKLESLFYHRPGLSDFREIIYRYVNHMNRQDLLEHVSELNRFKEWIDQSKLTFNKQGRMRDILDANKADFEIMFELFLDIMNIKNLIIQRLDGAPANISSYTHVTRAKGGEGYVVQEPKIKLVPRNRWKPHSLI